VSAFPVLFEGSGILAINKPPGIPVIPGRGAQDVKSIREVLEGERREKIFVVHRLDRDTSGVLLFALNAATHRTLSMAFEQGRIPKRYLAIVEGKLAEAVTVSAPLVEARRGRMRTARAGEKGKEAATRISPVERYEKATLVEVEPLSGRTHQIRVHLQSIGHPLLFDHQYGKSQPLRECDLGGQLETVILQRTPLHASSIHLDVLETLAGKVIEAPLPDDMARARELLG
jgi:RluA family pseudouridine synthase